MNEWKWRRRQRRNERIVVRNRLRTHSHTNTVRRTGIDVRQAFEWKETTQKNMFCLVACDCAMDRTNFTGWIKWSSTWTHCRLSYSNLHSALVSFGPEFEQVAAHTKTHAEVTTAVHRVNFILLVIKSAEMIIVMVMAMAICGIQTTEPHNTLPDQKIILIMIARQLQSTTIHQSKKWHLLWSMVDWY